MSAFAQQKTEKITLGGGCFWCLEAAFEMLDGVSEVVSGYAGGDTENPSYRDVCSGETGHAEVVQISFDPEKISLVNLLEVFFTIHDPTTLNRQGMDAGTQYRSVIFYHNAAQQQTASEIISGLEKLRVFRNPIVTEIQPLSIFYPAEEYHQNYFANNPNEGYCQFTIVPKLQKMKKYFSNQLK
ncbi:MAG TPA: peptide-methionine (S)-S-oxide reductase MsrA [Bacteroidales bacterium]|nr:peptide-methionine (S)-S-oxide reductase MsrA [Bacteroidales bacterium]